MGRRGDKLREHILWIAKDVFLEMGFERTSMDVVASRAETSKRSLYAQATFGISARASAEAAHRLLGQVLHPRLPRALFGMDQLAESFDREALGPDFDLKPIGKAVADLIDRLPKH